MPGARWWKGRLSCLSWTEHAEALRQYAVTFLLYPYGRRADSHTAMTQALEIAEAASATAVIPRILADLADDAFWCGDIREGFATLHRAQATAEAARDSAALLDVVVAESWYLLVMGNFARAEEVALRGLHAARRAGLAGWFRNTYPERLRLGPPRLAVPPAN
jgi:hypothetical protein